MRLVSDQELLVTETQGGGLSHTWTYTVTWGDCDSAGIVFYPRYYETFDASTHALLRSVGLDHRTLRAQHGIVGLPLIETRARFHGPATYDQVLTVESRVARIGHTSLTVEHRIREGERLVVEGHEVRVWARTGAGEPARLEPVPIPPAVRALLQG